MPLTEMQQRVKQERLKELLLEKKKKRGLEDLWYFDKYILGYSDMTSQDRFHGQLCRFIEDDWKYTLILEPRGSLKSSCGTIGYSVQQIIKNPDIRILLCSEEFNTAKKFLAEIKGHFESNEALRSLYGDFVGTSKWSEAEIIVSKRKLWKKEPTITCAGIDVTKVGLHYDLIIIDDPHSTKNITTREQIDKVITWYKLVLSLLDPKRKIVIIGTRWHFDDLSGWIIDQERFRLDEKRPKRYKILQKTAVKGKLNDNTPDSALLWPERLSKEYLQDQELDQGPYIFSCQYRNRPVDDESAIFKRSWVQFYDPEDIDPSLPKFSVLDPARDEQGRDWSVITTCAMNRKYQAFILEVRRGKWDEWDTLDQLIRCWKRWKPKKFGVESVAWQLVYYRFFRDELRRQNLKVPITELKTSTKISKNLRIKSMVPYWKSGLYLVPGKSISTLKGNMAILMDELLRYPKVSNDDCVDSLAYMDQLFRRPNIASIVRQIPPGSFRAIKNRIKPHTSSLGSINVR